MEADIDMESSTVANHVVALVKGVTTSQTIDMAVVLQVGPVLCHCLAPCPALFIAPSAIPCTLAVASLHGLHEEEEEFYKLRPANKTDHLCQPWQ